MSERVTATQLLDFLAKANKVASHVTVQGKNGSYAIGICADWDGTNHFETQITCIRDGRSTWQGSDYSFSTMDTVLNQLVKEKEERETKRQKREQLLSRLTDEEKELLGVK